MRATITKIGLVLVAFTLLTSFGGLKKEKHKEVKWLDWNKGYEKAQKKKKKVLLIDVYTDWCGWCKRMDADTYSKSAVQKRIKRHFIPVKFNPEKKETYNLDGEEVSGKQILNRLANGGGVGYPTTFFLCLESNKIWKVSGYQTEEEFASLLDEVVDWAKQDN
ncbi:MAG: DUF255 domain-containing protein [Bacteroidetes bacterium]|nr:DUF255 domain-containing protein [Bacteroidota bacterium]